MTDETRPEVDPSFVMRLLAQLPALAECVAVAKRLQRTDGEMITNVGPGSAAYQK